MLNSSKYRDITIGRGVCSLLGTTIVVYLYVVDGLLIDAGPKRLKRKAANSFRSIKSIRLRLLMYTKTIPEWLRGSSVKCRCRFIYMRCPYLEHRKEENTYFIII